MAENVMTGFMRGYQWMDDMQRRDQDQARQEKYDAQAAEDRTRRIGMENETWDRQRKQWGNEDKSNKFAGILYKIDPDNGGNLNTLGEEDWKVINESIDEPTRKTLERFKTPEEAAKGIESIDNIYAAFSGEGGDYKSALDAANYVLGDYINQGDGGTEKRIKDVFPSKSGKGFYLDLEMKDKDGKFKTAPMTKGRGTDDKDPVAEVDGAEMLQALGLLRQTFEAQLVSMGDQGTLERIAARKNAKAQAANEQQKFGQQVALKQMEQQGTKYSTFGSPQTGYFAFDPKTGQHQQLVGGRGMAAGGGGASGASGASGRNLTGVKGNDAYKLADDQLNKLFIGRFMDSLPQEQRANMAAMTETDGFGNDRVVMERLIANMPPELRQKYYAARQQTESFLGEGQMSPILAANKAFEYTFMQPQGQPVQKSPVAAIDPRNPQHMAKVEQTIATYDVPTMGEFVANITDPNNPNYNPELYGALKASGKLPTANPQGQSAPQPAAPQGMQPRTNAFPYQPGASTKTRAGMPSFRNPFGGESPEFIQQTIATLQAQIDSGKLNPAQVQDAEKKLAYYQSRLSNQ